MCIKKKIFILINPKEILLKYFLSQSPTYEIQIIFRQILLTLCKFFAYNLNIVYVMKFGEHLQDNKVFMKKMAEKKKELNSVLSERHT